MLFCCSSLSIVLCIDTFVFIDYNGSAYRYPQGTNRIAYPNANHCMAEIGSKIGFSKSAICKFFSFNSGGMSASGDFAVPMSFPRERDPGTGTKNKIVTDWQFSVKKIQINKNSSMTARKLHNKCDSLQNLRTIIRTMKRYLTVLLHKKHRFLLFGAYCTYKCVQVTSFWPKIPFLHAY